MDLGLKDRTVLITAASRGLGRACALTLAGEGMKVALAARDGKVLEALADEVRAAGGEALVLPSDLSDTAAPAALVEATVDHFGSLDALVVSTPGPPSMPCVDVTDTDFRDAMEMNCLVPIRLTSAALPVMRAAGGGRIVYIGTIGVRMAQRDMVLSNASRLALLGYAKTLALEVAADNVLVNMVAPGPLATERMDELARQTAERLGIDEDQAMDAWVGEVPLGRIGRAQDLASMVALLVSDACSYTTGAVLPIDGGKATAY